jgi:hypothetical protein
MRQALLRCRRRWRRVVVAAGRVPRRGRAPGACHVTRPASCPSRLAPPAAAAEGVEWPFPAPPRHAGAAAGPLRRLAGGNDEADRRRLTWQARHGAGNLRRPRPRGHVSVRWPQGPSQEDAPRSSVGCSSQERVLRRSVVCAASRASQHSSRPHVMRGHGNTLELPAGCSTAQGWRQRRCRGSVRISRLLRAARGWGVAQRLRRSAALMQPLPRSGREGFVHRRPSC